MICRVGETRYFGRAVRIDRPLDPERVARAVRTGAADGAEPPLEIDAAEAGPLHERVGAVHPDVSIRPRTALAVAARSRGWTTPQDDEIRRVRDKLTDFAGAPAIPTGTDRRRRIAEAREEIERLRERVASVRGAVRAASDGNAAAELEAAIRELSEVETTVAAAREDRRASREAAREARDRLQARLRLVDRLGNLQRRARRTLLERARDEYVDALSSVPGIGDSSEPFAAPDDAMALAVCRVGDLSAPVVVATDRFSDPHAAADWLRAPVIHLEP